MMARQADHLKGWIEAQGGRIRERIRQGGPGGARVLAVTSGKGGVGKTTLAVNLSLDLVLKGERVILLDADLGLANVNILLGIEPRHTLWDVVEGRMDLGQIVEQGPYGLKLVPGASGLAALARLEESELEALVGGFRELDTACDWLIADTGAGIAPGVLSFALAADEVLVVTQPEPTALTDAYGLIKSLWAEGYTGVLHLVVNRARSEREGMEVAGRLKELARRALGVEVIPAGVVRDDPAVHHAVLSQAAFIDRRPPGPAAQDVHRLTDHLLGRAAVTPGGGIRGFMARMFERYRALAGEDLPSSGEGG